MVTLVACLLLFLSHEALAFYNPETGRWLNRDPIGERGGPSLNGFAYNDGVNAIDLFGLSIECKCPEAYFKENGITPEMYTKSGDTYSAKTAKSTATSPSTGVGLILWRMLLTSHKFTAKQLKVEQLKRHVAARQTIVNNALRANFIFGTGEKLDWTGFRDDPQAFFNKLNNGKTVIACNALTRIIFETGNNFGKDNNGTWAEGYRNYDRVWIPGDWGRIDNRAYVSGVWSRGLEGENVIHTGVSGQDEMFWGHFDPDEPVMTEKAWFDEVKSWTGGGKHGDPVWENEITYPVTGLQK